MKVTINILYCSGPGPEIKEKEEPISRKDQVDKVFSAMCKLSDELAGLEQDRVANGEPTICDEMGGDPEWVGVDVYPGSV